MTDQPRPVPVPLLNPNEPEAVVLELLVSEGDHVEEGTALVTLETTKSVEELLAEASGYVVGLHVRPGQSVTAGDTLCYLASSPGAEVPQLASPAPEEERGTVPEGLRITRPALARAREEGIDLAALPIGPMVTESMLATLVSEYRGSRTIQVPESDFDSLAVVVYGGGGHGESLIDLLRAIGTYQVVGVVDDAMPAGGSVMGVPVLGGKGALPELHGQGVRLAANAVGGIGNILSRLAVFETLAEAGFVCPALAHPTAFLEPSAEVSPGSQMLPHSYVGSMAQVGFGVIVNTGAIISHDCRLGDYVNVAPGAVLAGNVVVGAGTLIGMGVTVNLGVSIGSRARIGNSATVKSDIPDEAVVRAGTIWPS